LAGHFQLPDVDSVQLASDAMGSRRRLTSNYADVRRKLAKEHGEGNVYLLSRRFLDWAAPQRISGDHGPAGAKPGAPIGGGLPEARRQIQLEYEDVAAWLRLKGVRDLGPAPSSILTELIRIGSYPRLGLSVKPI